MYKKMVMAAILSGVALSAAGCQAGMKQAESAPVEMTDTEAAAEPAEGESWAEPATLIKGESRKLVLPSSFQGKIRWSTTNGMRNVGSSKKKAPLEEGETDGERRAGWASADHMIQVDAEGRVTALEKGNHIFAVAEDEAGNRRIFPLEVRVFSEDQLPKASEEDFKALRKRYTDRLTGGDNDMSDPEVSAIVRQTEEAGQAAWDSYRFKGTDCAGVPWEEDLAEGTEEAYLADAAKFRKSYQKAEAMAKAYATAGSALYKDEALLKDICNVLGWLSENCYYPRSETDNWWNWEIGMPKNVLPAILYIYDDISPEQSKSYAQGAAFFVPDPFHMGALGTASTLGAGYTEAASANLMDCAYTAVGLGLIYEDGEYLALAREAAATTMTEFQKPVLGENGRYTYTNGFYEDGSYVDHGVVPYTTSYGMDFLKGSVQLSVLLGDSPWELGQENRAMLEAYILRGYLPAIYKGAALDMLRGRAIARPTLTDRDAGAQLMEILIQTADIVSPEGAARIKGAVKSWILDSGEEAFLSKVKDVSVLKKAKAILADGDLDTEAVKEPSHHMYPYMDRVIHQGADWLFGVSMYSSRISNCEIMNDENLKGWYTGFGMTYLYNDDLTQYTDHFWDTVDPLKLPGTTVMPVEIDNGEPDSSGYHQSGDFLSPEDWVGGASIGDWGVSGMALNGTAVSNGDPSNASDTVYAPELRGKKSWFMFDQELVCLGAGIKNDGPVITTVENRKLREDASNEISSDLGTWKGSMEETAAPRWLHLEGNTAEGSDIGYYFPEAAQLHLSVNERTGSYQDIKGDLAEGETVSRNYFTCWFDHGTAPEDAEYSYVLLPGMSAGETAAYSASPDMEILENTSAIQAVRDQSTGITAVNFWNSDGGTTAGVSCDSQASVMLQEKDGVLTVSLADPTMLNTGTIRLTLEGAGEKKLIRADEGVKSTVKDGNMILEFSVNGCCGNPLEAELSD